MIDVVGDCGVELFECLVDCESDEACVCGIDCCAAKCVYGVCDVRVSLSGFDLVLTRFPGFDSRFYFILEGPLDYILCRLY
jgi:hypothetical protein